MVTSGHVGVATLIALLPFKEAGGFWPFADSPVDRHEADPEDVARVRRLEAKLERKLSIEKTDPRWLQARDQLPALEVSRFKLKEVAMFHRMQPWKVRHIVIPEDHNLERTGQHERRLMGLEEVVETPLDGQTPRDLIRVIVAANAASLTEDMYNGSGKEFLWEDWGNYQYRDESMFLYPKPKCVNKTTFNGSATTPPPSWYVPSSFHFCPDDRSSTTTTTTTTSAAGVTTTHNVTAGFDLFERDIAYLASAKERLRAHLTEKADKEMIDMFQGGRYAPCDAIVDSAEVHEKRCIDDVGVAVSVYESSTEKMLIYHGSFRMDNEYIKWAEKLSIIETMEDQVILQWTVAARQLLRPEMIQRHGSLFDEYASRCAFNDKWKLIPSPFPEGFYTMLEIPEKEQEAIDKIGLWYYVKILTRLILPEGRSKKDEQKKDLYLTGNGLGGAFVALVSLWLNKVEAESYPTFAIAPSGFQCMGHRMYLSDLDPWIEHPFITVYTHVMDAYAELGRLSGTVCLYGIRNFSEAFPVWHYCGGMIGHTGPQLLYDGTDETGMEIELPRPASTQDDLQWETYVARVVAGRRAFKSCHYFTHSPWYAAILMSDPDTLFLDGSTDGGCRYIPGVPKGDAMGVCPKITKADTECHKPPPARTPLPMKLMMSLMFATGVFITSCMIFLFVCIHTVKNDNWVYGREHKKYAEVKGCFDFKCLFPVPLQE